jgi:hypothetical protein
MRFIENTKSAIVLYVLLHCTRGECNGTRSIALLGNGIFYSISRDHKQPIKRLEFNKVLYKGTYMYTQNIHNSSTRSHPSEEENRTRNRSKNCKCILCKRVFSQSVVFYPI